MSVSIVSSIIRTKPNRVKTYYKITSSSMSGIGIGFVMDDAKIMFPEA